MDLITEVIHRKGVAKNGNSYEFWQQSVSVTTGGQIFEVSWRSDTDPGENMVPHQLDDIVRIKVGSPRMYNGQLSFDAA